MNNPLDESLEALIPPVFAAPDKEVTVTDRWEHRVVKKLLQYFGRTEHAASMTREAKARTGVAGLTFAAFKQRFPTFPMWLTCRKIPFVHEMTFQEAAKFKKCRVFKAFEKAESEAPEPYQEGRFGLVFEWLHVWPMAIIHNDYQTPRLEALSLTYPFPHTDPPQLFALQSFDTYLASLLWSPE